MPKITPRSTECHTYPPIVIYTGALMGNQPNIQCSFVAGYNTSTAIQLTMRVSPNLDTFFSLVGCFSL